MSGAHKLYMNNKDGTKKRAERAEYHAALLEAELNAVKESKAYRVSKKLGHIKNQIKSDPIGLSKKVAKKILRDPRSITDLVRSANRGASIAQSVVDQNA